jgi:hypothetical protein
MTWYALDELDPQTLEHGPHAHGMGASALEIDIVPSDPEEARRDLTQRLRYRIPIDATYLGVEDFDSLVGTATDEQIDQMRDRLRELNQRAIVQPAGSLAVAS